MYILNLRSKTIHKHPTLEQCNMDACKKKLKSSMFNPVWKKCKHCFK